MPKTTFERGSRVPKEWFNSMQSIQFDGEDLDGHYPQLDDEALTDEPGNIKSEFYGLRDALSVTTASGLNVNVESGSVSLPNGTSVTIPDTALTLPNNSTRIIFVSDTGVLQASASSPSVGVLLARVTTSGGQVSAVVDLRPRKGYQVAPLTIPSSETFLMPSGVVVPFAGSTVPSGWLLCDGSEYLRSQYPGLFAAIGTTWGSSSGTTFRVPDMRDRVVFGADTSNALGTTGGANTKTLTQEEMPAHSHVINDPGHAHSVTDPGHNHSVNDPGHSHPLFAHTGNTDGENDPLNRVGSAVTGELNPTNAYIMTNGSGTMLVGTGGGNVTLNGAGSNISVRSSGTGITAANQGGTQAFSIKNRFATMNYIIKA